MDYVASAGQGGNDDAARVRYARHIVPVDRVVRRIRVQCPGNRILDLTAVTVAGYNLHELRRAWRVGRRINRGIDWRDKC